MRVLVTDLDGTLLGGEPADRKRLRDALARHPEVMVVFATGRGLPSVREVLRDPLVPRPRWVIADVGATVVDGTDLAPLGGLQARLRAGWPGAARVRAALARFPALVYQSGVAQDGRCSFHLDPARLTREITDAVRALGCGWSYSGNRYFDVLPPGASKGNALAALARAHKWPMSQVLVAGDSLNDLSLYGVGAHGVIVGNAEPALSAAVPAAGAAHRPQAPGAAGVLRALRDVGWVERDYPLVVGYHRPPVTWTPEHGWRKPVSPNGILPTLHSVLTDDLDAVWVTAAIADTPQNAVDLAGHGTGLPLSFVPLRPDEWAGYFHRACKDALWPVLMSQSERMRFDPAAWTHYRTVNERFAHHISDQAAPNATVWLHDYNLWLVPGVLRRIRPDLSLGLFHHTPFPPPDVLDLLPIAAEIRTSLGCLDWAGFHTEAFAERFRRTLTGTPHRTRVGVHPLGVDRAAVEALVRTLTTRVRCHDGPLVLSVERLDYIKAPVEKVDAIAELLARRPDLRGRLRFRLICPPPEPGITAYEATRQELEARIGQVNRDWSAYGHQPIEYLPHALTFAEVVDHYLAADILWVTPLQDGMNLTAKEYIAAHTAAGLSGVLVLSRHAGAADELGTAALLTDPRSPEDLVVTLGLALAMPPEERRTRMKRLADKLGHHPPSLWASQIITAIPDHTRHPATHVLSSEVNALGCGVYPILLTPI